MTRPTMPGLPPCDHHWNKWDQHGINLERFYCDKPANGWVSKSPWPWKGRLGNYCKAHQLDSNDALVFIKTIRELQYRWATTGYLEEPVEEQVCPTCGESGFIRAGASETSPGNNPGNKWPLEACF